MHEMMSLISVVVVAPALLGVSLIISACVQDSGKAGPALFLALTKQGIFLIPLVFVLPLYFGIHGIWMAFPIADLGAALVSFIYYKLSHPKYPKKSKIEAPQVAASEILDRKSVV